MPMERWTFAPYFFYLGSTLALWNVGRSRLVFLSGISLGTLDLGIDVLYLKSGTTNLKSGTGGTPNTTRTLSSATVHTSTRSCTYSRTTLQDIGSLQIFRRTKFRTICKSLGLFRTREQAHDPESIQGVMLDLRKAYPYAGECEMINHMFRSHGIMACSKSPCERT